MTLTNLHKNKDFIYASIMWAYISWIIIGKIYLKSLSITIILPLNNSSNTSVKSLKVLSIDSKVYQYVIDILSQIINVIKLYNQSFMCKSLYVKFDMYEK